MICKASLSWRRSMLRFHFWEIILRKSSWISKIISVKPILSKQIFFHLTVNHQHIMSAAHVDAGSRFWPDCSSLSMLFMVSVAVWSASMETEISVIRRMKVVLHIWHNTSVLLQESIFFYQFLLSHWLADVWMSTTSCFQSLFYHRNTTRLLCLYICTFVQIKICFASWIDWCPPVELSKIVSPAYSYFQLFIETIWKQIAWDFFADTPHVYSVVNKQPKIKKENRTEAGDHHRTHP